MNICNKCQYEEYERLARSQRTIQWTIIYYNRIGCVCARQKLFPYSDGCIWKNCTCTILESRQEQTANNTRLERIQSNHGDYNYIERDLVVEQKKKLKWIARAINKNVSFPREDDAVCDQRTDIRIHFNKQLEFRSSFEPSVQTQRLLKCSNNNSATFNHLFTCPLPSFGAFNPSRRILISKQKLHFLVSIYPSLST